MVLPTLTDAELDSYISARLALSGIDLSLLPLERDPATGSPTAVQALASLRSFARRTLPQINGWRPESADAAIDPVAASQQLAPPLEYPSITEAWTSPAVRK
ncbi:hypothetical protein [Nakamurella lactea]|uniref:hypothetical protein n=1 Tax=Nakamurella lactea TaxID=459515 RepID=UPI000406D095|nr:hypothetical protein [Nakamurella lactea]